MNRRRFLATIGLICSAGCLNLQDGSGTSDQTTTTASTTTAGQQPSATPSQYPLSLATAWEQSGSLDSRDGVLDDGVFYGHFRGQLEAIDISTGEPAIQLPKLREADSFLTKVTKDGSDIAVVNRYRNDRTDLHVLDAGSGKQRWVFEDPAGIIFEREVVFTPGHVVWNKLRREDTDIVYLLNREDGTIARQFEYQDCWAVSAGRERLFLSYEDAAGSNYTDVYSISDDEVVRRFEGNYRQYEAGWLYDYGEKLRVDTGERTYLDLPDGSRSQLVLSDDTVVMVVNDRVVLADRSYDTVRQTIELDAAPHSQLLATDSRVWVIDEIGTLYALGYDGEIQLKRPLVTGGGYIPSGIAATSAFVVFSEQRGDDYTVVGATIETE